MTLPASLPAARREAASAALTAAFGAQGARDWRLLQGGVSGAQIWRIAVGERPYVLRLEPERVALRHRQRGYAAMTAAAVAGVAPPVRYADAATGIAVMDFIESRPLSEHQGGAEELLREFGSLIARVQATAPFPTLAPGDNDLIAVVLAGLRTTELFAPGLLDPHADGLARIRAIYPCDPSALVSAHNDPNPRNMLFDGRRVWLVDWELAGRNDPLFDLAILTLELAAAPELEATLVEAATGRPPDEAIRARLAVTRLLARLFYGCVALEAFAGVPRDAPETSLEALTPAAFLDAARGGRLGSPSDVGWAFGKMSLAAFVDGVNAPGFKAVLGRAQG